jgi:hypothetical protein
MGLGELSQKVVTYYRADTSDHKAKIRELSGEQKKLAQQQLADLEKQNKRVDSHIGSVGKLASTFAAVGAAIAAVDLISDAFSSKLVKNMNLLRTEVQRLGGDGGPVSMMLNWEKAAANLNDRLKETEGYMKRLGSAADMLDREERAGIHRRDLAGMAESDLRRIVANDANTIQALRGESAENLSLEQLKVRNDQLTTAIERRAAAITRLGEIEEAARKKKGTGGGGYNFRGTDAQDVGARQVFDPGPLVGSYDFGPGGIDTRVANQVGAFGAGVPGISGFGAIQERIAAQDMAGGKRTSMLESIFGSPDEMDLYRGAFQTFSSTVQESFDAWVDKSEGAGLSFKKLFREILGSSAKLMFGQAILHGAMALGEWAWGRNVEAVKHGKAAAALGAGAVTVGAIARQLGGGGSAAAGTGGGSAAYGGDGAYGGRRGPDQGGTIHIYNGDDWASKSTRERATQAREIVDTARRGGSGESSIVRYD